MSITCLITGATGFVGGHLAEAWPDGVLRCAACASRQRYLGAGRLWRDSSTRRSGRLGGGARGVGGRHGRVSLAAKVGDWGPVQDYRTVNVDALRGLLEACRRQQLQRFVHFSSLGVYAARHHHGTDETEPPPMRHMDGYTQTKVEAEQLCAALSTRIWRAGRGAAARLYLRAARSDGAAEPD